MRTQFPLNMFRKIENDSPYHSPIMLMLQPCSSEDRDKTVRDISEVLCSGGEGLSNWSILHERIYEREYNITGILLVRRYGWVSDVETLDIIKKRAREGRRTVVIGMLSQTTELKDLEAPLATKMLFDTIGLQSCDLNTPQLFLIKQ